MLFRKRPHKHPQPEETPWVEPEHTPVEFAEPESAPADWREPDALPSPEEQTDDAPEADGAEQLPLLSKEEAACRILDTIQIRSGK